jgi:hypothetical protein
MVAVQCKRWRNRVGPSVIREPIGATSSGRHQGESGMLMTSAAVTTGAQELAAEHGMEAVGRDRLQQRMLQVNVEVQRYGDRPRAVAPGGMRPAGQVLAGHVCCGLIMLIVGVFLPSLPAVQTGNTAAKPSWHAVSSAQERVVEDVFAAINRR